MYGISINLFFLKRIFLGFLKYGYSMTRNWRFKSIDIWKTMRIFLQFENGKVGSGQLFLYCFLFREIYTIPILENEYCVLVTGEDALLFHVILLVQMF